MTSAPTSSIQAYLPTTQVYPKDQDELLTKLTDVYTKTALAVNVRGISLYDLNELNNGHQFFTTGNPQKKRFGYRKVFEFGAIAAGATLNIAHGLTGVTLYTRIYGTTVLAGGDFRPLPFVSATVVINQTSLRVLGANIVIVNGTNATPIVSGIVVLEYLKN